MGKKVWTEEVEVVVGVDKDGNEVKAKQEVQYKEIVCDYCGKVIENTKEGVVGNAYVQVGDKYYHQECYEVIKLGTGNDKSGASA